MPSLRDSNIELYDPFYFMPSRWDYKLVRINYRNRM